MSRENIDVDNLEVTGALPRNATDALTIRDDVIVIVNEAFGPGGEALVGVSNVAFDGFPALTLRVRGAGRDELVHLSPIHGDGRKLGMDGLAVGTKCELLTPAGTPLEKTDLELEGDAEYFAIYLTPKLQSGSMIYVSDLWGHHHSRVVDNNELISCWAAAEDGEDDAD